jgi:opine dehydrogenase
MRVCICGGGNEGHCIAGVLANRGHTVSLLTRQPELWNPVITVFDTLGQGSLEYKSKISRISNNAADVVPEAEVVLISVPCYAYRDILNEIAGYLNPSQIIGALPGAGGFDYVCSQVFGEDHPFTIFSSQRVPYICRTRVYGESVEALGSCYGSMKYATYPSENSSMVCATMERLFNIPSQAISSFLCVNLMNSNSLLHTTRLYALMHGKVTRWDTPPLFYADWDDHASELLIACDKELRDIFASLPDIDFSCIKPILEHYESVDAQSLTRKIRSIPAFKSIKSPVVLDGDKYMLDYGSRYFTADFPYGIGLIACVGRSRGVHIPLIEQVAKAGLEKCGMTLEQVNAGLFPSLH